MVRVSQEVFRSGGCGLASMYPASHEGAGVKLLLHFETPRILRCGRVDLIDQGGAPITQVFPANLTSGGTCAPTTVPHSGRESSRRATPLFETMRRHQAG